MGSKASAGSIFEFWQKIYIYLPFSPILILLGVNKIGYLIFCNTFLGGKKGLLSIRHGLQDICLLCLMHGGLSTTHLREAFQLLLPLNVALPIASIMGPQILVIELTSAKGLFQRGSIVIHEQIGLTVFLKNFTPVESSFHFQFYCNAKRKRISLVRFIILFWGFK